MVTAGRALVLGGGGVTGIAWETGLLAGLAEAGVDLTSYLLAMVTAGRALVLGGGGGTGIAWETGLLAGLAEAGVALTSADLVVGTSAGSVVGAQILSGVSVQDLYAEQLTEPRAERAAKMGATITLRFAATLVWPGGEERARARLGRAALKARTVPESERKAIIKQRLPADSWPERRLLITAVDAETGELRGFDRDGGVSLLEAGAPRRPHPPLAPPIPIPRPRLLHSQARL